MLETKKLLEQVGIKIEFLKKMQERNELLDELSLRQDVNAIFLIIPKHLNCILLC